MKEIDLNASLYELTEAYPELIDILRDLGFSGVADPHMRSTHGKVMTILSGCELLGIDLDRVVRRLAEHGFTIKPQPPV